MPLPDACREGLFCLHQDSAPPSVAGANKQKTLERQRRNSFGYARYFWIIEHNRLPAKRKVPVYSFLEKFFLTKKFDISHTFTLPLSERSHWRTQSACIQLPSKISSVLIGLSLIILRREIFRTKKIK